ncbi:MAG: prepilin-type N-terminal cleavage/methylation domain-containing protein [Deltaproteobacteria bacterium]|nr:MAG: prepilin-type N-terminal cleavage/methylation domain-containing protein [Deltaproteobacteria bacterium]
MKRAGTHSGFVLIELVVTLILIGVIGTFTSLFLYTGVTGFITSKKISETALKTQIAMDRIGIELRNMVQDTTTPVPVFASNSIRYKTDKTEMPGTREVSFDSSSNRLSLRVNGTSYLLLDGVQSFTVATDAVDMDYENSDNELSAIRIVLQMVDVGTQFTMRFYPRNPINMP